MGHLKCLVMAVARFWLGQQFGANRHPVVNSVLYLTGTKKIYIKKVNAK
jgi:hypothetical protein